MRAVYRTPRHQRVSPQGEQPKTCLYVCQLRRTSRSPQRPIRDKTKGLGRGTTAKIEQTDAPQRSGNDHNDVVGQRRRKLSGARPGQHSEAGTPTRPFRTRSPTSKAGKARDQRGERERGEIRTGSRHEGGKEEYHRGKTDKPTRQPKRLLQEQSGLPRRLTAFCLERLTATEERGI